MRKSATFLLFLIASLSVFLKSFTYPQCNLRMLILYGTEVSIRRCCGINPVKKELAESIKPVLLKYLKNTK